MRDQSMRKSARSSTAVLVWTTVQQEKRSSGPAALAVHRYGAEPSSHLPEAPDTSQLECQQSRQRRRGRRASGGCLLAPTSSRARRGSRVVALAVSPPAPPSKRPCPTARRRGCPWSGAVTTSPWLLEGVTGACVLAAARGCFIAAPIATPGAVTSVGDRTQNAHVLQSAATHAGRRSAGGRGCCGMRRSVAGDRERSYSQTAKRQRASVCRRH